MGNWESQLNYATEHAYRTIENDPQVLLEVDGGPVGATADIVIARLYGHDGQIDHEIRLQRALLALEIPVPQPVLAWHVDYEVDMPTARYTLQSGFCRTALDARYAPPDVPREAAHRVSLLFLRYRRERIASR